MVKKKIKDYASMGVINCSECKTEEEWAEKNRKFRKSRGMLEW